MGWVEETFKAGQSPFGWLSSAERLQAAAEIILEREEAGAPAYFSALEAARQEAEEKSRSSKDGNGHCGGALRTSELFAGAIAVRICA
jgi:hypothetical protein